MTADDDFKTLRRHTREEAVQQLHIPPTWLKRWVTEREVPHHRSGQERGVWRRGICGRDR